MNFCETEILPINEKNSDISKPLYVCFVCSGNTCRSPMAKALLNDLGRKPLVCSAKGSEDLYSRHIIATSAGLSAINGNPISENAVNALIEAGVISRQGNDFINHRAKRIDETDFLVCDYVIGMTSAHAVALMGAFPQYASKISCMTQDIPDPYGFGLDTYIECLEKIRTCLKEMFFGDKK